MFYAFILFFILYDSFLSESFLISPYMPSGQGYYLTCYTNYVLNGCSKHSSYIGKRSRMLKKLIYSQKLFFLTPFF